MAKASIDAWGAPERYYAGWQIDADKWPAGKSWEESLDRVAPGVAETVERSVERWKQKVRNCLATEMGFDPKGRQIPVRTVDGLPPTLDAGLAGASGAEAVMLNRHLLQTVVGGMDFMEGIRDVVLDRRGGLVGHAEPEDFGRVRDTAWAWLEWADENDVRKIFSEIPEDMFGAYMFKRPQVLIFWLPIGLFASMHDDTPIEAMTVVVLAHELAHAYTHRGFDIDGLDWPTDGFIGTDVAVIEGLAQFYTKLVCDRLYASIPEAPAVFASLLERQHKMYRTHEAWTKEAGEHSREVVRTSMVECRRAQEPMNPDQFATTVSKVAERFRVADGERVPTRPMPSRAGS